MTRRWLDPNFFTDEKVGRLSMPERQLFAAMIANQDDDGRLKGHPAYLRSIAFPYDELTTEGVCQMRDHIAEVNPNVIAYQNAGEDYIQLKRHKRYQKPRYYHPSKLPPPPGWPFEEDKDSDQTVTKQSPSGDQIVTKQHTEDRVGLGKGLDLDKGRDKGIGRGRGAPTPSPTTSALSDNFPKAFGRNPTSRELAYLRDIEKEISAAGATAEQIRDAFKEAATQNKLHLSYVRAILLDWLGVERNRSP